MGYSGFLNVSIEFGEFIGLKVLMGLCIFGVLTPKHAESLLSSMFSNLSSMSKKVLWFFGVFKAAVVDKNTLRRTPGLDLVCVPNLVVVGLAVLAKNVTKQTDRQTDI